jgi:hypothetical protein
VDLLKDFISYSLEGKTSQSYQYLNRKTNEYITLDNETVERLKAASGEKIEKKKVKYADELK